MRVVAVGERVPAIDQDSLTQRTSVAPIRARRGCAGCEIYKTKQLATSVAEVQLILVQMVCALRIKTLWNDLLYIAMYTSFACNVAAIIRLICQ